MFQISGAMESSALSMSALVFNTVAVSNFAVSWTHQTIHNTAELARYLARADEMAQSIYIIGKSQRSFWLVFELWDF